MEEPVSRVRVSAGHICLTCRQPLTNGQIISVDGGEYHASCFTCAECKKPIDGSYLPSKKSNGFICGNCARQDLPKCAACGEIIEDACTKIQEKVYHKKCLNCVVCKKEVRGQYFPDASGGFRCGMCNRKQLPKCCGCNKPIESRSMVVEENSYHPDCFKCVRCQLPIPGQFCKEGDGYMCSKCVDAEEAEAAPRCAACKRLIAGKMMTLKGQKYHKECFVCKECNGIITGPCFPHKNGVLVCAQCNVVGAIINKQNQEKTLQQNPRVVSASTAASTSQVTPKPWTNCGTAVPVTEITRSVKASLSGPPRHKDFTSQADTKMSSPGHSPRVRESRIREMAAAFDAKAAAVKAKATPLTKLPSEIATRQREVTFPQVQDAPPASPASPASPVCTRNSFATAKDDSFITCATSWTDRRVSQGTAISQDSEPGGSQDLQRIAQLRRNTALNARMSLTSADVPSGLGSATQVSGVPQTKSSCYALQVSDSETMPLTEEFARRRCLACTRCSIL
eukprot:gnl/MRDRNA2_/MRDRNA2_133729_c0_seq1.p1 gnl/MRDRNA2_/MRDRNA2_133729_c0~~gnl/MRDRNA2_/MRDRNA2_133729_c0_seq1.p1  ORF type:complete len:509 (+),score=60.46 gnl/MRDRNA2_/MRDRNA2_133729_c0_seq1:71-1597(+)